MRVSLPICIAASLLVVVLTWWLNTRSKNFTSAPSEAELEQIRISAAQTNPTAQGLGDALSPAKAQDMEGIPIAVVLPRHVNRAPQLDDYRDEAKQGAAYLMELARLLTDEHPERALTCWERVIDSCKANEEQQQRAARAIRRLKKSVRPWNEDASNGIPIIIEVGTGPSAAALLEPLLTETSGYISMSSSGVVQVRNKISTGEEDMIENGRAPVAMWISGASEGSSSTDVVSFFIPVESPEGLSKRVKTEVYRIIQHHLGQMDDFQPLPKPGDQYSPDKLLEGHITRMVWKRLAESLQ